MRKFLAAFAVLAGTLVVFCLPASAAGNWAVTYMDPLPGRFEAGTSYAVGFWVLQHGTHPYEGKMEPVGLRLTGADGKSITFEGTALPEAGHYATSVVVPKGEWRVQGIQGPFQPHEVGTLKVPGSLRVIPVSPDLLMNLGAGAGNFWDAVRPPAPVPPEAEPAPLPARSEPAPVPAQAQPAQVPAQAQPAQAPGDAEAAPVAPPAQTAPSGQNGGVPSWTLLLAAAAGALIAVGTLRLPALSRRRKDEQDPPVDSSADTIVIPG